jgi:hypothetical protein
MQGLNSANDTYTQKMVRRYERTGKLATSRKIDARVKAGGGVATLAELKEIFAEPTKAESKPVYPCTDCGEPTRWHRVAIEGQPPKCPPCRRKARLASKRATWHRHKEQYRTRPYRAERPERVARRAAKAAEKPVEKNTMPTARRPEPTKVEKAPVAVQTTPVAPDAQQTRSPAKGPVIVWTPR